jgi:hypothetical protein
MNKESLLNELRTIECNLSPENLCADGEAPARWVKKEYRRLQRLRAKVIEQLGYEPSVVEIFDLKYK